MFTLAAKTDQLNGSKLSARADWAKLSGSLQSLQSVDTPVNCTILSPLLNTTTTTTTEQ